MLFSTDDLVDLTPQKVREYDRFIVHVNGYDKSIYSLLRLLELGAKTDKIFVYYVRHTVHLFGSMDWVCTEGYVRVLCFALGINFRTMNCNYERDSNGLLFSSYSYQPVDMKISDHRFFFKKQPVRFVDSCSFNLNMDIFLNPIFNDPRFFYSRTLYLHQGSTNELISTKDDRDGHTKRHIDQMNLSKNTLLFERFTLLVKRYNVALHPYHRICSSLVVYKLPYETLKSLIATSIDLYGKNYVTESLVDWDYIFKIHES